MTQKKTDTIQATNSNQQAGQASAEKDVGQFGLLFKKRYGPFFCTMFLGALNDNLFRSALLVLLAIASPTLLAEYDFLNIELASMLSVVLFMTPYFVFSAIAGQLADKYDKTLLVRLTKLFELSVMGCAILAFWAMEIELLLLLLFLMGTQSAFFSPMKYAILPQHLHEKELVGGNGILELGTFLAILFGLIVGSELMKGGAGGLEIQAICEAGKTNNWQESLYCSTGFSGTNMVSAAGVTIALLGLLSSLRMPSAPSVTPNIKIDWNIPRNTKNHIKLALQDKHIWYCMLGVSWFWAIGGIYLAQMTQYGIVNLGGTKSHYTPLLAAFALGIGVGSGLCEWLSRKYLAIAWAWLGAYGLAVCGIILYFMSPGVIPAEVLNAENYQPALGEYFEWADLDQMWPIMLMLLLLGVFGGLFSVPLTAEIQRCAPVDKRAQIIAANNIINAAAMMVFGGVASLLLALGMDIPQLFLLVGVGGVVVAVIMTIQDSRFWITFLVKTIMRIFWRVKLVNGDKLPRHDGVILACNHVAWIDWFIIGGLMPFPPHFIMNHDFYNIPVAGKILKWARVIPIAPEFKRPDIMEKAFDTAAEYLKNDEAVFVFPEGKVSRDGDSSEYRTGICRIHERAPVPVIPMAVRGMWGSWFSYSEGRCMKGPPKRWGRSKVEVLVGDPIPPEEFTLELLQQRIEELRGDWR